MHDGKLSLMDDTADENCFVTKCLSDSFDFNDLPDNTTDTHAASQFNKTCASSSWSPRFEFQRKRIGDLCQDIGEFFENEAAVNCFNDNTNRSQSEGVKIEQTAELPDSLRFSSLSSVIPNDTSTESTSKTPENPKGSSVDDCIIIDDDDVDTNDDVTKTSYRGSSDSDDVQGISKNIFTELFINIPNHEVSCFDDYQDESIQLGNYQSLLKVCKNGSEVNAYNSSNFDSLNAEKCIGLSSPIKPGDKVEFINGSLVKISSRKTSVETTRDNQIDNAQHSLLRNRFEIRQPLRRHSIDDRHLDRIRQTKSRVHSRSVCFPHSRCCSSTGKHDAFKSNIYHSPKLWFFSDDQNWYRKRYGANIPLPSSRNVHDISPPVNQDVPLNDGHTVQPLQSNNEILRDSDRGVTETQTTQGLYDVGDWEDWMWLCDPGENDSSDENVILKLLEGSDEEQDDDKQSEAKDTCQEQEETCQEDICQDGTDQSEVTDKVVEEYDLVDHLTNTDPCNPDEGDIIDHLKNIDHCNPDEGDIVDHLTSTDPCNPDESDIVDNLTNTDPCDAEEDDPPEGALLDDQDWGWLVSLSNFMYECN